MGVSPFDIEVGYSEDRFIQLEKRLLKDYEEAGVSHAAEKAHIDALFGVLKPNTKRISAERNTSEDVLEAIKLCFG